jgi:hypothetical protein
MIGYGKMLIDLAEEGGLDNDLRIMIVMIR